MAVKQKDSEVEHLRAVNKQLKSENRNLKKQLGHVAKRVHQYEDLEEKIAEEMIKEEQKERAILKNEECPECNGKVNLLDIGVRTLYICDSCGHRLVKKKR